jgi:hypothetical protein
VAREVVLVELHAEFEAARCVTDGYRWVETDRAADD